MTKAEAIAMLKRIQEPEAWEPQINQAAFEALGMAIETLSQESREDVISRQEAISLPVKPKEDRYFQTQNLDDAYDYGWYSLQRCIEKLPSVQPDDAEANYWHEKANSYEQTLVKLAQSFAEQPKIIRCKECKHSEHWYRDKRRCFLWVEDGIDVFDDGFCNYAERRTDETD